LKKKRKLDFKHLVTSCFFSVFVGESFATWLEKSGVQKLQGVSFWKNGPNIMRRKSVKSPYLDNKLQQVTTLLSTSINLFRWKLSFFSFFFPLKDPL
jgi:hypothetical protein